MDLILWQSCVFARLMLFFVFITKQRVEFFLDDKENVSCQASKNKQNYSNVNFEQMAGTEIQRKKISQPIKQSIGSCLQIEDIALTVSINKYACRPLLLLCLAAEKT